MYDEINPSSKKEENDSVIEELIEEEKLSREIARKYIYNRNRERYPLPFEEYKIYHIDGKLFNDSPNNIYLCTNEQRKELYEEQIRRGKHFESAKEIDLFLESIKKTSKNISKDIRKNGRGYDKIPLYWKQRDIRKKQTSLPGDPHPELRENIIKEIKEAEEKIELKESKKRFYSLPPKRHPELKKQLIMEIRKAEDIRCRRHRKLTLTEKIIILIGILAVIGIFLFFFRESVFNISNSKEIKDEPFSMARSKLSSGSASQQLFSYEIRTERYFILVINNDKEKDLNIEIEYNRHSRGLNIDENKTIQAYVPAKEEVLLKDPEFSINEGCLENDCEISILSSRRI